MTAHVEDVLRRIEALAPRLTAAAATTEANRRLAPELVTALAETGCFRIALPRELGGCRAGSTEYLDVLERVARADGSAGWCVMIAVTSSLVCGFLDDAVNAEIFRDPLGVTAGVVAPTGTAKEVDGGYEVSGRWSFASGCEHAAWRMVGVVVLGDDGPKRAPSGAPIARQVMLRGADTNVIDTWTVSGLRGTGSHDLTAEGVFVPASHALDLLSGEPRVREGVLALPVLGVLAAGIAAVGIGIASAALDAFVAIAREKRPMGAKRAISERELVQALVAECDADIRAARAHLRVAAEGAAAGDLAGRARLRIAATRATHAMADTVQRVYKASGGSAIYATQPMQRYLRDALVTTQHVMVGEQTLAVGGRVLLGLDTDATLF
ncbi:MAG: acyl-CoA dehydrogenase family protein [Polyangiaceae bacterium]